MMLSEEWDFQPSSAKRRLFYCVAATPRSGSTFLCHLLWATGCMGAPAEYFDPQFSMLPMASRLRARSTGEYVKLLKERRTSPNGVFGFKAFWRHFRFMADFDLLGFFPRLRFVHIERQDRLAQAVSLAKAEALRQWSLPQ